jgi:hypothetical protein
MPIIGEYPFTVFVGNTFKPGSNIKVTAKHFCHRIYYDTDLEGFVAKRIEKGQPESYEINPGLALGFSMFFKDNYVEISISGSPAIDYQVGAGIKAKCYPNKDLGMPRSESYVKAGEDDYGNYYIGGIWDVNATTTDWKLIIRKLGHDPEEDDVRVGPREE